MKTRKLVLLIMALIVCSGTHAQFLKKLKKSAEEAAERAVTRKVEEKTEKETEKTFDTVFNNNRKLFKNKKANVADSYSFTHQYTMEITSGKNVTDITYYLTNDEEYMGSSFSAGKNEEFITVMDLQNSAIHSFMNFGDQKSMTSIKIDLDDIDEDEKKAPNFNIVATGQTKIILGYTCEEFQVTGSKLSGKAWVTKDAEISFQKAFSQLKTKKMKLSKGMDQSWVSMVDGLALEMEMIDYSDKKPKPIKMMCTELKENAFSIETADYQN